MKYIDLIKKNEFVANIIKLISGTAFGQLITFLVSPLLTRIYTPTEFGIFGIYLSIVSIIGVIICLRFDLAVLLPEQEQEALDIVSLGIIITSINSLFLLLIFIFFGKYISELIGQPEFRFYLLLVPFSTLFYGIFQLFVHWTSRLRHFSNLALTKAGKEVVIAGTQLSLGGILQVGTIGLISGHMMGNITGISILAHRYRARLWQNFSSIKIRNLKTVFLKYKKFPQFSSWATFINAISQNIPALLLAFLFSTESAGFYIIASRALSVPAMLIGNSVKQVYFQRASELYNSNQSIYKIFRNTTYHLALIAIVPICIVFIWAEPLFTIIFGAQWIEAGRIASIISLWTFFTFINPPSVVNLFILGLNKTHLVWEIFLLVFRVLSFLAGFIFYDDVIYSICLFTAVGIIFNIILITLIHTKLKQNNEKYYE